MEEMREFSNALTLKEKGLRKIPNTHQVNLANTKKRPVGQTGNRQLEIAAGRSAVLGRPDRNLSVRCGGPKSKSDLGQILTLKSRYTK